MAVSVNWGPFPGRPQNNESPAVLGGPYCGTWFLNTPLSRG